MDISCSFVIPEFKTKKSKAIEFLLASSEELGLDTDEFPGEEEKEEDVRFSSGLIGFKGSTSPISFGGKPN